jgi:hypothetical protein
MFDATKVCPLVFENRIAVCVVIAVIILSVKDLSLFIQTFSNSTGEFDPGSERTLAACLTHASRTDLRGLLLKLVAHG